MTEAESAPVTAAASFGDLSRLIGAKDFTTGNRWTGLDRVAPFRPGPRNS